MKAWYTNSDNTVQVGEIVDVSAETPDHAASALTQLHPNSSATHIGVLPGFFDSGRFFPNPNYNKPKTNQENIHIPTSGNPYSKTSGWAGLFNVVGWLWLVLVVWAIASGGGEVVLIGIASALSLFFFAALINMGANSRWLLAQILQELPRNRGEADSRQKSLKDQVYHWHRHGLHDTLSVADRNKVLEAFDSGELQTNRFAEVEYKNLVTELQGLLPRLRAEQENENFAEAEKKAELKQIAEEKEAVAFVLRWHDILQADYTLDQFTEFDEEFKNVDTIIQRTIRDGKLANREEIEKIYLELCSWAAEIRSQYTEDLSDLEE